MENATLYLPAVISAVLLAVLVLTVITNIITEVLKKALYGIAPANVLALAVAMILTILAALAACQIMAVAVTWYILAGAVCLGFFVTFAAMFGFDKFRQTLEQITNTLNRKE